MVQADKAANNVIVVCRKYYLEVVLRELSTSNAYECDEGDCEHIVSEHLQFMRSNKINIEHDLHTFTIFLLATLQKRLVYFNPSIVVSVANKQC